MRVVTSAYVKHSGGAVDNSTVQLNTIFVPTPHRQFKDALYAQFARIGKTLSAPKRLELLDLLSQGPRSVEQLAEQSGTSVANTSQHLQVLRHARMVSSEKKGLRVEYRLADNDVSQLFLSLRGLAESRLLEVEQVATQYFEPWDAMEPVASEELLRRVRNHQVTVLDVRPALEYRAGHIPGALSIPVNELEQRLGEVPQRREVVAYCRGPYCVMAMEAVQLLQERGFTAVRMELGVTDWRARGWAIKTGNDNSYRPPTERRRTPRHKQRSDYDL